MPALHVGSVTRRWESLEPDDRGFALGLLAVLPLTLWWLGWYPGFLSGDSIDQWGQVIRFDISNQHPAFHTSLMWLATRVRTSPGAVTLLQVLAMAVVLAVAARRLVQLGSRPWAAGLVAIAIASLPAVGATTIALWKDVPFTIAMVWAFTELLGYAARPERWSAIAPAVRMGGALSLVWLFRHNGFITVVIIGVVLVWRLRRARGALIGFLGALVGVVAAVNLILYPLIDVDRTSIQPATVFVSDVAASFVNEPQNFTADEVDYLASIAPLDVWRSRYECHDSTPLVFSPDFNSSAIIADPGRFRELVVATYLRDPDTVLGHRWCAASYLVVPWQTGSAYFHRLPFEIPENEYGITRRPVSDRAHAVTLAVYRWAEAPGRLWLTWRPGLVVWAAAIALALAAARGRAARLALPVTLIVAHIANVALTTPAQEFRFAFPIYVMSLVLIGVTIVRRGPTEAPGR